VTPHELIPWPG